MNLCMVGIDYHRAALQAREAFSLTQSRAVKTARQMIDNFGAEGCVVLSTCNRTEIWLSGLSGRSPLEAFCCVRGVSPDSCAQFFTERSGQQAVEYLFSLACGLESQIFGEDQILTQVKNALTLARENQCADTVLEVLFRSAVTCGKRVRSHVRLTANDTSVPARAAALLEETHGSLRGKRCLVIGNGEMGRLAARCFLAKDCAVTMTLRQYKRQDVLIPAGAQIVHYDERFQALEQADLVISATLSPHYTLTAEQVAAHRSGRPLVLADLAVPRDLDPEIRRIPGVTLFDMDTLAPQGQPLLQSPAVQKAKVLIAQAVEEFLQWEQFRGHVPTVKYISRQAGRETKGKLRATVKRLCLDDVEEAQLKKAIETASAKTTAKLLYSLRGHLSPEHWEACMQALEEAAEELSTKPERSTEV